MPFQSRTALFVAVSLACTVCRAEEAKTSYRAVVSAERDVVSRWMGEKRDTILKEMGWRVSRESNDTIRLVQDTRKGTVDVVVSCSKSDNLWRLELVKSNKLRVTRFSARINIGESGKHSTSVQFIIEIKVDERDIKSSDIYSGMSSSVREFERIAREEFRK